jgi:hypothetical protein
MYALDSVQPNIAIDPVKFGRPAPAEKPVVAPVDR